ncbi:hypothetical protein RHMOL_Rhmol01G0292500 [Rhododendron molle]|uniref:Uncharacterized protein n=1 Tax=Rhododendron molle TaxID=49168 RepID=A0ACC0Q859_RHOML|nr:hypothetical protein RHMOL_Rhmol01G0292500 [Rhododendron molle]
MWNMLYSWWLMLCSYFSVDIVYVIMSHTLLGSFWTPAYGLISTVGVDGASMSELLRKWRLFIYFRDSCRLYSFVIKDRLWSF